jgi:hypothetical protein
MTNGKKAQHFYKTNNFNHANNFIMEGKYISLGTEGKPSLEMIEVSIPTRKGDSMTSNLVERTGFYTRKNNEKIEKNFLIY